MFPGELLYYMATGRSILAAVSGQSETSNFINEHRVGLVTPPEDAPSLAEAILRLKTMVGLPPSWARMAGASV